MILQKSHVSYPVRHNTTDTEEMQTKENCRTFSPAVSSHFFTGGGKYEGNSESEAKKKMGTSLVRIDEFESFKW